MILPLASQPTRADEPSGRGRGEGGGRSRGRSKLLNWLDGHKINQLATALFTFQVASEMAKGILEENDPNPLQEASVPGGWSPKSD